MQRSMGHVTAFEAGHCTLMCRVSGREGYAHQAAADVSCLCAGWFLAIIYMVAGIPLGWWLW